MRLLFLLTICSQRIFAGSGANDLAYEERAILGAEVHIAREGNAAQLGVWLEIRNNYASTISCSGQFLAIIEKDGIIDTQLLTYTNLEVFPDLAFPYRIVHPIGRARDLADGYTFAAERYKTINVTCRGWDFLQPLHPKFCQQNKQVHDIICAGDTVRYPFLIAEFWIGSCQC